MGESRSQRYLCPESAAEISGTTQFFFLIYGIGDGYFSGDIEGKSTSIDANVGLFSFTGTFDMKGNVGGSVSVGKGVGVSANNLETKTYSLRDLLIDKDMPMDPSLIWGGGF